MLNRVVLMGRLTADPELRSTNTGRSVSGFSLACDRNFVRQGGERETDFFDIVVWGATAEFVCKYFSKGQLVAVSGRLQSRKWRDRDDRPRVSIEVVADEVHFAEPKRQSSGSGYSRGDFSRPEPAPKFNDDPDPLPDDNQDDFSDFGGNEDDLPF
jgi:single-strand DNA-binding protein